MPPLPTAARPASNCGLISATSQAPGRAERQRHGQRLRQRDEAHVGDEGADGLRHEGAIEPARVATLERDDPGSAARRACSWSWPDVDGIDARRAAVEQHLGEAAGRGADVEGNDALHRKAEMVEGGDQLRGSARHVSSRRARQADGGIGGDAGSRPRLDHAGDLDQPAANEVLGTGARSHKPPLDQGHVEAGRALAHVARACIAHGYLMPVGRAVPHPPTPSARSVHNDPAAASPYRRGGRRCTITPARRGPT